MGPSRLPPASLCVVACAACDDEVSVGGPDARLDLGAEDARPDLPLPADPDVGSVDARVGDMRTPPDALPDAAPPDAARPMPSSTPRRPTWRAWPSHATAAGARP